MARLENMEEINDGDYGYSMQKDTDVLSNISPYAPIFIADRVPSSFNK